MLLVTPVFSSPRVFAQGVYVLNSGPNYLDAVIPGGGHTNEFINNMVGLLRLLLLLRLQTISVFLFVCQSCGTRVCLSRSFVHLRRALCPENLRPVDARVRGHRHQGILRARGRTSPLVLPRLVARLRSAWLRAASITTVGSGDACLRVPRCNIFLLLLVHAIFSVRRRRSSRSWNVCTRSRPTVDALLSPTPASPSAKFSRCVLCDHDNRTLCPVSRARAFFTLCYPFFLSQSFCRQRYLKKVKVVARGEGAEGDGGGGGAGGSERAKYAYELDERARLEIGLEGCAGFVSKVSLSSVCRAAVVACVHVPTPIFPPASVDC